MNQNTVAIKIYKESFSYKVYLNLGTWVDTQFKVFSKMQLIDYDKDKKGNSDSIDLNFTVLDNCEDKINVKVKVNNNSIENELSSDFFLPFIGKYSLMFGGIGDYVNMKILNSKCYSKTVVETDGIFSNEKKNCNCCIVF